VLPTEGLCRRWDEVRMCPGMAGSAQELAMWRQKAKVQAVACTFGARSHNQLNWKPKVAGTTIKPESKVTTTLAQNPAQPFMVFQLSW
jgi:hypothetical protein